MADKVFSVEELSQYDGRQADGRIYMALNGLVYDVTTGGKFYGSGGPYAVFAGKDATRGLASFNFKVTEEPLLKVNMTSKQKRNVDHWEKLFQSKYSVVGRLSLPVPVGGITTIEGDKPSANNGSMNNWNDSDVASDVMSDVTIPSTTNNALTAVTTYESRRSKARVTIATPPPSITLSSKMGQGRGHDHDDQHQVERGPGYTCRSCACDIL